MPDFLFRLFALICLVPLLSLGNVQAQPYQDAEFGVIPDSLFELSNTGDYPYTVTNKEMDISFREADGGITAIIAQHVRLKVFDGDHPEASVVAVPYYFDNEMEQLVEISGTTYLPSGEQVPLREEDIRTININSRYNIKEFQMPAVEDGAVLEYRYVIHRRYIEELPDFHFSHRVPTLNAKATITYPRYLRYESVVENYEGSVDHSFSYTDTSSVPKIFTIPQPDPVVTERWVATDIPAVEEEAFTTSLDNYRGKIKFLLNAFGLPRQPLDTGWEVVVAQLRRNINPWSQIEQYDLAREKGDSIARSLPANDTGVVQDSIYHYLNERVNFSGNFVPHSTTPDSAVLAGEAADQAAINQTLLAMLRGAGIEAYPLLTSTRSSGEINREFPSFYQFNALAVYSNINGEAYIMDAGFPYSHPNLIPTEINNGEGLLLREKSFEWISMQVDESLFDIEVEIDAELAANGTLSGEVVSRQQGYPARLIRQQKANGNSEADILRQVLFDGYSQLQVSDAALNNSEAHGAPVELRARFEIPNYATSFSDGLEFPPMVVGYRRENPFEDSNRTLPITLDAPERLRVSYSIALPQGSNMREGAESRSLEFPGASFEESYDMESNLLNYDYSINISRQNFAVEQFDRLYQLYNRWVELSNSHWLIEQ